MQEWSDRLNPFNSMKALIWSKHLEGCAKRDYLPPVIANIDPTNRCNFDCIWCSDKLYRRQHPSMLSTEHLLGLIGFLAEWGVKSVDVSGGGEPTLHEDVAKVLWAAHESGMQAAIVTNGSNMTPGLAQTIAETCRWVGFSVDAGTAKTHDKVHGLAHRTFGQVLRGMEQIRDQVDFRHTPCQVTYKFLLHPENEHEIYLGAVAAREAGCHNFLLRPVCWRQITVFEDYGTEGTTGGEYNLPLIQEQIEHALELEDANFRVAAAFHKFGADLKREKKSSHCWASPLAITFAADGNVYLCCAMRGRKEILLCRHVPDVREVLMYWNSPKHKKMVRDIDINKCPSCTLEAHNEIVERVFVRDDLHRMFP